MSMTHERPPVREPLAEPVAPPESSQRAWVAVLSAPFVIAGATVLGFAIDAWWGDLIMMALVAVPILGGFVLGLRSARTGNRSGALAAATAAAEALFLVMFLIGANVIEFASDGTSALVGVASAVAAFVVAEIVLYRISSAGRVA